MDLSAKHQLVYRQKSGFDFLGFVLVATFLGTLEIVLDRGLEDDWFGSSFSTTVASVCALAEAFRPLR